MEQIFLSFVIPAYNAERYLPRCLDSILAIGDPSVEIVVINDGSKDGTEAVLERYAEKGVRYRTVPNGGVSAARDAGAAMAEGQYITFADADDEADPAIYREMLQTIRRGERSDVYMFGFDVINQEKVTHTVPPLAEGRYGREGFEQLSACLADAQMAKRYASKYIGGKVYQYLVKKELFADKGLCFPKGLAFAEDLCYCIHLCSLAQTLTVLHRQAYRYYVFEGSASHRVRLNMWDEMMAVCDYIKNLGITETQLVRLRYWYAKMVLVRYVADKVDPKIIREKGTHILSDERFVTSLERLDFQNWTVYEKLENRLLREKKAGSFIVLERVILFLKRVKNKL